jgi:LCP family protein required for cell wall assembly
MSEKWRLTMKEKDIFKLVRYGFAIIQSIITLLFLYYLAKLDVLPQKYFFLVVGVLIVLCVLNVVLQFKKIPGIIMMVIGIIISIGLGIACVYIAKTTDVMNKTAGADEQIDKMLVYVLADDEAKSLGDAADYTYGILSSKGREATDKTIEEINKTINKEIAIKEYDDFFSMIDGLYNGDVKAIILNEAYIDVIIETEGYEDFKDKVKELLMTEVKSKVEWYEQDDDSSIKLNSDVFTLYISGIDTYGSVAKTSRSDVNIIAVVNTKTKQILLVSTPRDYYVPLSISNGVKDKLTHAGLYGINCSKDTLSMIYDLDIQYYFRLNFDGFIKIIDKLGGVTVHSDYAFTTRSGHYNIQVGDNKLNGKEALAFARERYALADGDRQRGRDQMEVIKAVINEMASSKLLYNYTDIMDAISDCFQTSMPKDMIQSLVKMQINDMKKWNIVSCSADGTGTRSSTYSIPQRDNLWVMIPDESTIEHAKELIQQVIDGKIISE